MLLEDLGYSTKPKEVVADNLKCESCGYDPTEFYSRVFKGIKWFI